MGNSLKRTGKHGKPRYTAIYVDLHGKRRSAGTFSNKKAADRAWHEAEDKVAQGRGGDPARGKQTFRRYVEDEWLPHHVMEPTTREGYYYSIHRHVMPTFENMKMRDILPSHVREWVTKLTSDGLSPRNIQLNKTILSSIFTTALNDGVVSLHACQGVKTPTVPTKPLEIVTPEQFDTFHACLPDTVSKMLVEVAIESGLRWGELAELRPADINTITGIVTVSRKVAEINPKFHPDGQRFLIVSYPKDKEWRRFKLSKPLVTKLKAFIKDRNLTQDDLLFPFPVIPQGHKPQDEQTQANALGLTEPNEAGRRYQHGTLSGYGAGKCRCEFCRGACATYRAKRRSEGKDRPRKGRAWDTDGHIPRRWFREHILKPSLLQAQLEIDIVMHALRHAHASWLIAGGADLQVVKERLGHGSIKTTEKYLHTLPDSDDSAVDAFMSIRRRNL
ncbi:MAG: tyrosine-type recombinase/integrase [Longispora sp.]|nr:tyrosine-type recombinase/integrase [Longispora sp. (in: high G+C Gram-positive bacteria)]